MHGDVFFGTLLCL